MSDFTERMSRALDSPDSLFDMAMSVVITDTEAITRYERLCGRRRSREDMNMPVEVCERFIEAYQGRCRLNDDIAHLFSDNRSRLRVVKLRNAQITDVGVRYLMEHKPRELELVDCDLLTPDVLQHINDNAEKLQTLKLVHGQVVGHASGPELVTPALRRLTIRQRGLEVPVLKLTPLDGLTHLDLSECRSVAGLAATRLERLEALVLHGVPGLPALLEWMASLKRLRHLDVSQANERHGKFPRPNATLGKLVTSLPLLNSLDISGTNLAGSGAAREEAAVPWSAEAARCDVPGLASRAARPLAFLGLYGTQHAACKRHDIPALTISGDANQEQLLTAARAYSERSEILTRVLNDLYFMYRYEENHGIERALDIVLHSMGRHLSEKTVQISGSASLFYMVKDKELERLSVRTKRRVLSALLLAMEEHIEDETMMRNGCLGLTRFSIPTDVLFMYEKMAIVLMTGVLNRGLEEFVRRMGIYLLNSLACQVENAHKSFLGKCGAVAKMLTIISERLDVNQCDNMLEMAWSTLWNMTDEMPENCERFLRMNGLNLFLSCLRDFPNMDDLLRNMMGLLGNVAENQPLRKHIMTPHLLGVFYGLLNSTRDGIEVSYNAGGVLAHIASEGAAAWPSGEPTRGAVLERLVSAIESWELRAERNINYRSFRPILSLLHAHHTPQCQHWAAWALANLTTVYPDKYCKLIRNEGGLEMLESVVAHDAPYKRVKELCAIVIKNVQAAHTQVRIVLEAI